MHFWKLRVDPFISEKRKRKASKKIRRNLKKRLAYLRAAEYRNRKAVEFGSQSLVAEMLSDCANYEFQMPQTSLVLTAPENFSMLEAPESVLNLVCAFARTHKNRSISDIFVDFSKIKTQDLGAHTLLDALVDEIVTQAKFQNTRVAWKGAYPKDPAQQRFIRAMGIIKLLDIRPHFLRHDVAKKIHVFERRCRHYVKSAQSKNPMEKTEQANAAERFANHIDSCLSRENKELTNDARGRLCSYVTEIIDNAENHAGLVDWTIQGYLDTTAENPQCEIVIFNFGRSIAKTFDELPEDSFTKLQIQPFLDIHTKKGWFGTKWRREDLLTLVSLQSAVSSKNTSDDSTRGQGMADLIDFFQTFNESRLSDAGAGSSMYIVSGATRILFDGKYRLQTLPDGAKHITFNSEGSLESPPDPMYVMPLGSGSLPGTMIGIKFPIQSQSMRTSSDVR